MKGRWLSRLVTPGGGCHALVLGGVGMVAAVIPYARTYVQAPIRRGLGLLAQDRMFQAINAFPGLHPFESPEFADKIQMVQQVSNNTASRLISSGLSLPRSPAAMTRS